MKDINRAVLLADALADGTTPEEILESFQAQREAEAELEKRRHLELCDDERCGCREEAADVAHKEGD